MSFIQRVIFFSIVATITFTINGCSTIRSARQAQKNLSLRGDEAHVKKEMKDIKFDDTSLFSLVSFALTNHPSMTKARLSVKDSRLALKEISAEAPLASLTPWGAIDVNSSLSYGERSKSSHFSDLKAKTLRSDASGAISINLLLYDFGRNAAQAREQSENVLASELSLTETGFAVFNDVSRSYFALHESDALFAVAQTNVLMATEHLERAEQRFEDGLDQALDVLRARLDLATAKEKLIAASNDVVVAGANLMSSLGVEATDASSEIFLNGKSDSLKACEPIFSEEYKDYETLYSFALTNAPSLKIARARLRAASARVDRALADMMPNVSANVSLNWTDPLWYWHWGVDLVQSVFTGWKRTTAVDRAVVAMQSAEATLQSTEQTLSSDIAKAQAQRENALKAQEAALESLEHARNNFNLVREKLDLGEASRIDLTDATSAYISAEASRISSFYRWQIAEASLISLLARDTARFSISE